MADYKEILRKNNQEHILKYIDLRIQLFESKNIISNGKFPYQKIKKKSRNFPDISILFDIYTAQMRGRQAACYVRSQSRSMPRNPFIWKKAAVLPPFLDTIFPKCYHDGGGTAVIPAVRLFPSQDANDCRGPDSFCPSTSKIKQTGRTLNIFDIMGPVMVGPSPIVR